jgi:hypothetical protein
VPGIWLFPLPGSQRTVYMLFECSHGVGMHNIAFWFVMDQIDVIVVISISI